MFPAESEVIPLWLPFTPRFICIHSINVTLLILEIFAPAPAPNSFKHTKIQNTWQIQWEVSRLPDSKSSGIYNSESPTFDISESQVEVSKSPMISNDHGQWTCNFPKSWVNVSRGPKVCPAPPVIPASWRVQKGHLDGLVTSGYD